MNRRLKKTLFVLVSAMVMMFAMSICAFAGTPADLTQIGVSETGIQVQWTDTTASASVKEYYGIQVATDPNFANVVKTNYEIDTTRGTVYGLTAGNSYYVRVGCGTDYKNCFTQNLCTAIICATAPTAPAEAAFIDANDTTATISWTPSAGATSYIIAYANNEQIAFETTATSYALPIVADLYDSVRIYACRTNGAGVRCTDNYKYFSGFSGLTTKLTSEQYGVQYFYSSSRKVEIGAAGYQGTAFDVQLAPVKGKGTKEKSAKQYQSYIDMGKLKANTMYKYRVRAYVTLSNGTKKTGSWSDYRYMVSTTAKGGRTYGGIKIVLPKMSGVNKAVISVSTKKDKGYKKCATISGLTKSKTYVIKKYGKKALKKRTSYYVKVEYYAGKKASTMSDIYGSLSVYYY